MLYICIQTKIYTLYWKITNFGHFSILSLHFWDWFFNCIISRIVYNKPCYTEVCILMSYTCSSKPPYQNWSLFKGGSVVNMPPSDAKKTHLYHGISDGFCTAHVGEVMPQNLSQVILTHCFNLGCFKPFMWVLILLTKFFCSSFALKDKNCYQECNKVSFIFIFFCFREYSFFWRGLMYREATRSLQSHVLWENGQKINLSQMESSV